MSKPDHAQLEKIALKVREHIIRMSTDGGCFTGASLSCVDLIVYLYLKFLNLNRHNLTDPHRDYLFLSKGHNVPALYGTFVELGLLERQRLKNHLAPHDSLYWHPNRNIPGVEFHSGSLGHLLAVAVGVAIDCKLRQKDNKVVVITGDGELNEGSNWEACLVAAAYKLDNLAIVVDRNTFQANEQTEDLIPLEPLGAKFEAFGCAVDWVDGHNFAALDETFAHVPFAGGKPSVIIAETVRGRGLPSLEKRADRWFCNFTHAEVEQLLQELYNANNKTHPISETLLVR
ncbi:MAG: transketolase [Anaerolineae bacterium]|nr:transketolase [Anaerolineae bacterium]